MIQGAGGSGARTRPWTGHPEAAASRGHLVVALHVVLALLVGPSSAAGQSGAATTADLGRVETLTTQGRLDEARGALEGWWDARRASAPREELQRAYYLRARLTVDAADAELDYRRLVVEFPGGRYSDEALMRLAHAAHARGELVKADDQFRTLLRDYPTSPHRIQAQDWLARFGAAAARAREAGEGDVVDPMGVEPAPASPGGGKADAGEAAVADAASPPAEKEAQPASPYAVQIGAFASESRAWRLSERARAAGLDPRLARIPGSSLVRVRVGHFPDSPSAQHLLNEVRELGFEATIVTDALEEVPVR